MALTEEKFNQGMSTQERERFVHDRARQRRTVRANDDDLFDPVVKAIPEQLLYALPEISFVLRHVFELFSRRFGQQIADRGEA